MGILGQRSPTKFHKLNPITIMEKLKEIEDFLDEKTIEEKGLQNCKVTFEGEIEKRLGGPTGYRFRDWKRVYKNRYAGNARRLVCE